MIKLASILIFISVLMAGSCTEPKPELFYADFIYKNDCSSDILIILHMPNSIDNDTIRLKSNTSYLRHVAKSDKIVLPFDNDSLTIKYNDSKSKTYLRMVDAPRNPYILGNYMEEKNSDFHSTFTYTITQADFVELNSY